jgi:hypothetical protein
MCKYRNGLVVALGYPVFSNKLAIEIWPLEVLFSSDFLGESLDDFSALIFPIVVKHYRCICSYTQGYTQPNEFNHTHPTSTSTFEGLYWTDKSQDQ